MRRSAPRALRWRLLLLLVPFAVVLATASPGASRSTESADGGAAVPDCSLATANQLVEQYQLNSFGLTNPIRQVLCGSFMGPGSQAMAVTIGAPTCWPIQQWAILGVQDGVWRLLETIPAFLIPPLRAVGNDIREETAVRRAGDPRCLPSGGTHARLWHWDGTRFVAGPWQQVQKPQAAPRKSKVFRSPSGNIRCAMADNGGTAGAHVSCWSVETPKQVIMGAGGQLTICRGIRCLDYGCGCIEGFDYPKLAYGRSVAFAPFRCTSLMSGVRCIVASTGRGFLISRAALTRVG